MKTKSKKYHVGATGDRRSETVTVTDRSHGRQDGQRTLRIEPDEIMDFRAAAPLHAVVGPHSSTGEKP